MLQCNVMYSINSKPEIKTKYYCSDYKIHVRLKDINSKKEWVGFEAKLSYLVTYLFHFYYKPLKQIINQNLFIEEFNGCAEIAKLNHMLKSYFKEPRFRGIKVSFNYKKGDNYNLFGDVDTSCIFPNADIKIPHTLEQFFEMYKIDAFNYLFNDDCKIVISEYKEKQLNKFEKKEIKKNLLVNKENYKSELVKLW